MKIDFPIPQNGNLRIRPILGRVFARRIR